MSKRCDHGKHRKEICVECRGAHRIFKCVYCGYISDETRMRSHLSDVHLIDDLRAVIHFKNAYG